MFKIIFLIISIGISATFGLKCKSCASEDYESDCRKGTTSAVDTCPSDRKYCLTTTITKDSNVYYAYLYRWCGTETKCEEEKKKYGRNLYYCKVCSGPECNTEYLFKDHNLTCVQCNGNNPDSECALGHSKSTTKCPPVTNSCFHQLIVNGNTLSFSRGCARKEHCDVQKEQHGDKLKSCSICEGSNCNKKTLSQSCLKCESTDENNDCESGTGSSLTNCFGIACYMKLVNGVSTLGLPFYERGCALPNYCSEQLKAGKSIKFCKTCEDKSNCNSQAIDSSLEDSLSCITCRGRKGACVSGTAKTSKKCSSQQNACFETYLENEDYSLVKRGCGTNDFCEKEMALYGHSVKRCRVCDGLNCNFKTFTALTCYSCKGCSGVDQDMNTKVCSKISDVCFHVLVKTKLAAGQSRGCSPTDFCETSHHKTCKVYYESLKNYQHG